MKLLEFQKKAIDNVLEFYDLYKSFEANTINVNYKSKKKLDPCAIAWMQCEGNNNINYSPLVTVDGTSVPNVAVCIPTGGGKTITGLSIAIELIEKDISKKDNFILWMVPSDAIYMQVQQEFRPNGRYHQYIYEKYNRKINLKITTDTWTDIDIDTSSTTILLISYQAIIRRNNNRNLHIFKNSDKVYSISKFNNLKMQPSLYELLKIIKPITIIDEAHRYYTEVGREFFKSNQISSIIIELTATPKKYNNIDYPNIVFAAYGKTLIQEELIKKPIIYHSLFGTSLEDLLKKVISFQRNLEFEMNNNGIFITPKILISTEFTGEDFANNLYSAHNIRNLLIKDGISNDEIGIKSSELDDLGNRDLDLPSEKIRFILTKRALMEGWDCKSIYGIVLVNKIGAEITNFQLIGRGLRQLYKKYFTRSEFNELHLFTNGISQDSAILKLMDFLSESGLSDSKGDFLIDANNRQKIKTSLINNFEIFNIKENKIDFIDSVLMRSIYFQDHFNLKDVIIDPNSVYFPEEIIQKIDLSSTQYIGNFSGKSLNYYKNNKAQLTDFKEVNFIKFITEGLRAHVVYSSKAYQIASEQYNVFKESDLPYFSRQLVLKLLIEKIEKSLLDYSKIFFKKYILPNISLTKDSIKNLVGDELIFNCEPDLGLELRFKKNIFGNVPKSIFNNQELLFARFLDDFDDIYWMRNPVGVGLKFPYSFGYFYPDFVVFKKTNIDDYRVIYIETKGLHLIGSDDSNAKHDASLEYTKLFTPSIEFIFASFDTAAEKLTKILKN